TTTTAAAATGATTATAGATTATAGPPTRFGRTRRHHAGVGLGRHVSRTRPASGFGLAFRRRALATALLLPAPLFALLATGTLRALPLSRRTGTDTEGIVPHTRTPRARLRAGFRTLGLGWHDTRTALAGVSIRTLLLTFGFALRRIRSGGRLLLLLAGRRSGLRSGLRSGFRSGLRSSLLLTIRSGLFRGSRRLGAAGRAANGRRLRTRCPALRPTGRRSRTSGLRTSLLTLPPGECLP